MLSERLSKLLETKDLENLGTLLAETGIIAETENNIISLENSELATSKELEDHYNTVLHYLPDDLKEFFDAYKILWDIENLKLLLSCISDETPTYTCARLTSPFGYMDFNSIQSLAKSKNHEELLKNSIKLLPTAFSSGIVFERETSMKELEFALDLAAFEYLQKKSEQIKTKRVQQAWSIVKEKYEIENLITLARLKYSKTSPDNIVPFLFPSRKRLDDSKIKQLVETDDYSSFLRALRDTPYGELLQNDRIEPSKLGDALKKKLGMPSYEDVGVDVTAYAVIRFLIEIEAVHYTIRKAVFLNSIKSTDEA